MGVTLLVFAVELEKVHTTYNPFVFWAKTRESFEMASVLVKSWEKALKEYYCTYRLRHEDN